MIEIPRDKLLDHAGSLRDSVVLITGGASGFGQSTALVAAKYGANVVIADVNAPAIVATLAEIKQAGGVASTPSTLTDVTQSDSLTAAFEHCVVVYGRPPDVVYANAGVGIPDTLALDQEVAATSTSKAYPRPPNPATLNVNLNGALLTCSIAREYWRKYPVATDEGRKRRLILTSSIGGQVGSMMAVTYSTAKHAILGYWKSLCEELEQQGEDAGFECHAICPYFVKTPIFPTAFLAIMAGIPLVPLERVSDSMVYAASRPSLPSSPPGALVFVPDGGDPAIALPSEYDPLSPDWQRMMHQRCAKEDQWLEVSGVKRFWKDIAEVYYGISSTALTIRAVTMVIGVGAVAVGLTRGLDQLSSWLAISVGSILGLAGRHVSATSGDKGPISVRGVGKTE